MSSGTTTDRGNSGGWTAGQGLPFTFTSVRIAALDLGANSFHLLVAEVHPDGGFTPVVREKEMLRLGDVVAREGRIPDEPAERAVATVRRFRRLADTAGADEVLACATSAMRLAANGDELVDRIEEETGVNVRVIDGLTEAELILRPGDGHGKRLFSREPRLQRGAPSFL